MVQRVVSVGPEGDENGGKAIEKHPDVVWDEWIVLDEWIVMPDHFHALLWLDGSPLSEIVGRFKGQVTWRNTHENWGDFQWQPRFHDEIVKYQHDFERIAQYIRDNPKNHPVKPRFIASFKSRSQRRKLLLSSFQFQTLGRFG